MIDVLYLTYNRLEFTKASWAALLAGTDWDLVQRLIVYDDSSTDGTREWIRDRIADAPVPCSFVSHGLQSPVGVMQSYLLDYGGDADLFAKIDSDIVVPGGWLNALADVMAAYPEVELLGAEAGRSGLPIYDSDGVAPLYGYEPCSHIGGVGLMRTTSFSRSPDGRRRTKLPAKGRFGFTEWQHAVKPVRGWIRPDLYLFGLDLLPVEPWRTLSAGYVEAGWQREWPPYDDRWSRPYYGWWLDRQEAAA